MTVVTKESQPEAGTETTPARVSILSRIFHRSDSVLAQMVRFGMVGAVATVVDFSILHVLANVMGMEPKSAAAIAFAFGLTVSYVLSIRWVFSSRTIENATLEFAAFAAIGVVGLTLTEIIIHYGIEEFGRDRLMHAKAFATVTVFGWNFGARRMFLFRSRK